MKKCPTCEKTFEDSMRFCQSDGTPLVEIQEVIDPYKTMVARPEDIAAAMPPVEKPKAPEPPPEEEEVLQIPAKSDPMKTQFVSEEELRREMATGAATEEPVIEIPPATATPAPPAFIDPDLNPVNVAPPPSPFSPAGAPPVSSSPEQPSSSSAPLPDSPGHLTTPPIPSPFSSAGKIASDVSPMVPQYKEPEPAVEPVPSTPFQSPVPSSPLKEQASSSTFDPQPAVFQPSASTPQEQQMAQSEWTPPPSPGAGGYQNPQSGQAPPPAPGAKLNQTLPIVSLVFGILSLCCYVSPLTGLIALVTGFLGMKNAGSDPSQYGGKTMAIIGMVLGGLFFFIGLAYYVFLIFFGGLSMMMNMAK